MIPRLHELETVNFMIRENHQRALRDHQASIVQDTLASQRPRTTFIRPVTAFIERVRRTRLFLPKRVPHAG
jgi:hypothetical protein